MLSAALLSTITQRLPAERAADLTDRLALALDALQFGGVIGARDDARDMVIGVAESIDKAAHNSLN